jgi:hypothetical protein
VYSIHAPIISDEIKLSPAESYSAKNPVLREIVIFAFLILKEKQLFAFA